MLRHVAKLLASDVIAKGANFLLGIYLVRNLSQESYGIYQYVLAILGYFTALGSFGLDNYALKQAVQSPQPEKFSGEIVVVKLVMSAFAAIIFFPVAALLLEHSAIFMAAYINVVLTISSLDWLLYFYRKSSLMSVGKLLAVTAKGSLLYLCLRTGNSPYIPLAADALFMAVPLSLYLFTCFKQRILSVALIGLGTLKHHLSQARFFFYFMLVNTIIASTDFILLKHILGLEAVAHYGIAYMYVPLTNNALAVIVNLYVPKIAAATSELRTILKSYFLYILAFLIALWICAAIFGKFFFTAIYTQKYSDVVGIFYWMIAAASLQSIQTYLISILNARNLMQVNFKICCVGAITNIAANLALIPTMGITGAAIAMLVSGIVMIAIATPPFYKIVQNG
jgi:O-antigen/teichoic acid export membrane protein